MQAIAAIPLQPPAIKTFGAFHRACSLGGMGGGVSRAKSVLVPPLTAVHEDPPSPAPREHASALPFTRSPERHPTPSGTSPAPVASPAAHAAVATSTAPLLETLSPLGLTLSGLRSFGKMCDAALACDSLSCSQVLRRVVPLVYPAQTAGCR